MEIKTLRKIEYLLPAISTLLYFFAIKNIIPSIIYTIVALGMGAYFFPIRLIINSPKGSGKRIITQLLSFVVLSTISVLSVVIIFSRATDLLTAFKILALLNFILLSYFYLKGFERSVVLTHLGFTVLTAAVIGI